MRNRAGSKAQPPSHTDYLKFPLPHSCAHIFKFKQTANPHLKSKLFFFLNSATIWWKHRCSFQGGCVQFYLWLFGYLLLKRDDPSSSSPSSPATLIGGVLCRDPAQEHSRDPERGTRHGVPVRRGSHRIPQTRVTGPAKLLIVLFRTARSCKKESPRTPLSACGLHGWFLDRN